MLLGHRLRTEFSIFKSHRLSLVLSDALVVLASYYFESTGKQFSARLSEVRIVHRLGQSTARARDEVVRGAASPQSCDANARNIKHLRREVAETLNTFPAQTRAAFVFGCGYAN